MSKVSVLIVGAGPTGLLMAYKLARYGISFRIIDNKPTRTQHSNAVAVQTRTLEIFKQMEIADDFLKHGQQYHGAYYYNSGSLLAHINFDCIDSVYPFVLAIPQSETERIINNKLEHLHQYVEWSRDLVDLHQDENAVYATIKHKDASEEKIICEYLIGCDGARSTVRNETGIKFPGQDIENQFIVADTKLNSSLKSDGIHLFTQNSNMLGVFPYGGNNYRIAANREPEHGKDCTEDEVNRIIATRSHNLFKPQYASWISPFWIHSKLAAKMSEGRIFLAGDAAHIHSPAGGQGMNTGLQDANNLAWKIALVVSGRADASMLDSYQQERFPVIKRVVDTTEEMTKRLLSKSKITPWILSTLLKLVSKSRYLRKKVVMRLTQLDINYHDSNIIDYSNKASKQSPACGSRAPDVEICQSRFLYDYIDDAHHHLLCFASRNNAKKMHEFYQQIDIALNGPLKDIVKIHLITPNLHDTDTFQIHDPELTLHEKYGMKKSGVILIRPDGYISYKSFNRDIDNILALLHRYIVV